MKEKVLSNFAGSVICKCARAVQNVQKWKTPSNFTHVHGVTEFTPSGKLLISWMWEVILVRIHYIRLKSLHMYGVQCCTLWTVLAHTPILWGFVFGLLFLLLLLHPPFSVFLLSVCVCGRGCGWLSCNSRRDTPGFNSQLITLLYKTGLNTTLVSDNSVLSVVLLVSWLFCEFLV